MRIISLLGAAEIALELDRTSEARDISLTALAIADAIGDRQQIGYALTLLAWAAADSGEPAVAGRLWGAVETDSARAPFGQWESQREVYGSRVGVAAGSDFDRGLAEGRSWT